MIFQHQNLTGVEGQLIPIRNALCNWKNIWDVHCAHFSTASSPSQQAGAVDACSMWKRIGFIRHCDEYWLLANLLVAKIAAATAHQRLGRADATDDNGEVWHARIVKPVLDKYDQTSMRQVNELITNVRSFQL